jgi:hypothetical protein
MRKNMLTRAKFMMQYGKDFGEMNMELASMEADELKQVILTNNITMTNDSNLNRQAITYHFRR